MLPSNLKLNIRKAIGYNNKILIGNTGMKIDLDKDINKAVVYHKTSPPTPPAFGRAQGAANATPKMHFV